MAVTLWPSQSITPDPASIPYTGNPLQLCWSDIILFIKCAWAIPGILFPWNQWKGGELDELYPSPANIFALALHGFLIVLQLGFVISLPFLIVLPIWTAVVYAGVVYGIVLAVCMVLNGTKAVLHSRVNLGNDGDAHPEECWIYLNGVATGHHWFQANLDRLALTFRRPITGVHNRTYGIVFDLFQCIIERNFCYATDDIRRSYAAIKSSLIKEKYKKVILILHSQGGIEGGLILDWLLCELPHEIINKLEIYTFGSAANHFNNPPRDSYPLENSCAAVRHIEHYANGGEFVARWGVLTFARLENRHMGRVFIRPGSGHLLNLHYLNNMFPLDKNKRVEEKNTFMDMEVSFSIDGAEDQVWKNYRETLNGRDGVGGNAVIEDSRYGFQPRETKLSEEVLGVNLKSKMTTVRNFSRLWCYRNGQSPAD